MNKCSIIVLIIHLMSVCSLLAQSIDFDKIIDTSEAAYIIMPNNSLTKCVKLKEKNVEYNIGVSNENKVIFISTNDTLFSVDGIRVGDKISLFCNVEKIEFSISNKNFSPGWGYYIPISGNWFAALDFREKPNKKSTVQFFFKYKF